MRKGRTIVRTSADGSTSGVAAAAVVVRVELSTVCAVVASRFGEVSGTYSLGLLK